MQKLGNFAMTMATGILLSGSFSHAIFRRNDPNMPRSISVSLWRELQEQALRNPPKPAPRLTLWPQGHQSLIRWNTHSDIIPVGADTNLRQRSAAHPFWAFVLSRPEMQPYRAIIEHIVVQNGYDYSIKLQEFKRSANSDGNLDLVIEVKDRRHEFEEIRINNISARELVEENTDIFPFDRDTTIDARFLQTREDLINSREVLNVLRSAFAAPENIPSTDRANLSLDLTSARFFGTIIHKDGTLSLSVEFRYSKRYETYMTSMGQQHIELRVRNIAELEDILGQNIPLLMKRDLRRAAYQTFSSSELRQRGIAPIQWGLSCRAVL